MSQDLVLANKPAYLQNANQAVDNSAFEAAGSPISKLSIKGGRFRIDSPEGSQVLTAQNTGAPLPFIDVIMVAVADGVSKTYYKQKFQEGSTAAPDCSSANGVVPSSDVPAAQRMSTNCATCPMNAWGSDPEGVAMGKKLKACRDSKRIAVMFGYSDQFPIDQRVHSINTGQLYLLQVPGGSLQNLTTCAKKADENNVLMQQIVIRISFDNSTSHPKLIFKGVRYLEEAEYSASAARANSDEAARIIGTNEDAEPAPEPAAAVPEQVAHTAPVEAPVMAPPAQPAMPDPVAAPAPLGQVAPGAPAMAPAAPAFDPTQMGAIQPGAAPAPIQGEVIPATQPAAPVAPANSVPTAEVDAAGVAWDPSIHSSTKSKKQDGTWKAKRGAGKPAQAAAPASTPAPTAPAAAPAPVAPPSASDDDLTAALNALLPPA